MTDSRAFAPSVFSLGACVLIGQILLFRELMSMSLGSELAVGLILAGWLVSVAAGSALGGLLTRRADTAPVALALALALCGFATPAGIALARCVRSWAGYIQGEAAPLGALSWMLPAACAPAAALSGLAFALLCRAAHAVKSQGAPARVYALDALGGTAGSLAFTFVLVFFLQPMAMSLWLAAAMMLCTAVWLRGPARAIAAACCVLAGASALWLAPGMESRTRAVQWGHSRIAAIEESQYGNITAVRHGAQTSLFSNGRLVRVTGANPGAPFLAHAAMSLHPHPQRVLLAGASPDAIREILKHNPRRVDVVELDPVMWSLQERFLDLRDLKMLNDPRVKIHIADARSFIFSTGAEYDIILVNAGEPETLLVNRYYTREFFEAARKRLARGGVLAFSVSFQRYSTSAWQADLLGSHLATLETVFPRPLLVAGQDAALLAAGRDALLAYDPAAAVRRYTERGVQADRFDAMMLMEALDENMLAEALKQPRLTGAADARGLLEYDLREDRVGYVFDRLKARRGARVNRDFVPVSTYYQTRVSGEIFRGRARDFMARVTRRSVFRFCFGALAGLASVFMLLRAAGIIGRGGALALGAAAAGCAGMGIEVVILFFIQVRNGAVYHFVGLVLAAFMAGGWAGAELSRRSVIKRNARAWHAAVPLLAMLCLCAAAAGGGVLESTASGAPALLVSVAASLAAGALTGASYALCAAAARGAAASGILYAADHLGAAAGAAAASAIIIPLTGVSGALWLCCAVLAAGAVCVLATGRS